MQRLDSPAELSEHCSNDVIANNIQMFKKKSFAVSKTRIVLEFLGHETYVLG